MLDLIANRAFTHRGRTYEPGDAVVVTTIEAIALLKRGAAKRKPTRPKAKYKPAKIAPDGRKPTPQHKRYTRDELEAEG